MASTASGRGRRSFAGVAFAALALIALLFTATVAHATELVYWDNYDPEPSTVSFANIDGSGGGAVNLAGVSIDEPEGMAYDPVTNRLYIANSDESSGGQIVYVNLDGSGAGVFTASGAIIKHPEGVAIDPATRTIYWANEEVAGSIGWAKLDGSVGGTLSAPAAALKDAYRIALDPVGGRVYWVAEGEAPGSRLIGFANVNNTGGGILPVAVPESIRGLATDPASGRLYLLVGVESAPALAFTGLGGGPLTSIPLGAADKGGYGLAVDPALGKAYWGNYGTAKTRTAAIGTVTLAGLTGAITPATAPVGGPQDPVILKSPTATALPLVSKSKAQLSCSTGAWAADLPGSYVYQSPRTYAYQWARNGAPLAGATAATLTATAPGAYACTVTAANQAGATSAAGAASATVTAAKFKLRSKTKKVKAKPGKLATFKVQAVNQGDLASKTVSVCLKVPKRAKADLKPRGCRKLKSVKAGAKPIAKLKLKVGPDAAGAYALKIVVKGAKPAPAKLVVVG